MTLNGTVITGWKNIQAPFISDYWYVVVPLSPGDYVLYSPSYVSYTATVYGYISCVGYGYVCGMNLASTNATISSYGTDINQQTTQHSHCKLHF